jgi:hypothetical protein
MQLSTPWFLMKAENEAARSAGEAEILCLPVDLAARLRRAKVPSYAIDIAAEQVVRWLLDEQRSGRLPVEVRTSRRYVSEPLERPESVGLGDEDQADLGDVVAVGILELSPPPGKNGWMLSIRMEDPLGPRTPDDEPVPEGEEEIDLETFQADFIAPGRATEDVTLDAGTKRARAHFEALFADLLLDRHAAGRSKRRSSLP